jgi:hypothetical protein
MILRPLRVTEWYGGRESLESRHPALEHCSSERAYCFSAKSLLRSLGRLWPGHECRDYVQGVEQSAALGVVGNADGV